MLPVHRPSTRPLHAGLSACLILSLAVLLLPGINPPAVQADTLYPAVPVSDVGTGNSLAEPNSSRMVAVSSDGTIYVAYRGTSGVRVARSTNRGQSFAPSVQISATDAPVSIAVDANGLVYVAYVTAGQVMFSRSTDGGQTFSTPVSAGTSTASSVDIAADAPYVYVLPQNGVTLLVNDNNGVGSFTARSTGLPSLVFSGILVDPESRDLFVIGDNPQLYYVRSADYGATWDSVVTPNGSVLYSTYVGGFGSIGQQVYIAGTGTTAFLLNLDTSVSSPRTFGNNLVYTGRTLAVDGEGNVIDGYSNSTDVFYAVSTDTGVTFDPPIRVATGATRLELAINPLFQDVVAVYEKNGSIYASIFASEIPPPAPVVTNPIANAQTSDATPTFSGTATADSTVTVADTTGIITFCLAIADASGAWSCTPTTALSDGDYTVSVTAATLAGSSSPTTVSFGVDATPPAPPVVTNPAAGAQFNTSTPVFSGTTTDADGITVMVRDDTSLVCIASISGGAWTCAPAYGLADGDYTLEFTANDAVGNVSTPVSRSIRIDTTPPAPPIVTSPPEGAQLNTGTPTFSGTATGEDGGTVTVAQNGTVLCTAGVSAGTWSCVSAPLSDGDQNLTITVEDVAGNLSSPADHNITIDTTAPADPPTVISPADGDWLATARPTFTGSATDAEGGLVTVKHGAVTLCSAPVSAGNWSCQATSALADGAYNLTFTLSDAVGNVGPNASLGINIDTTAPAPPVVDNPADDALLGDDRPTFSGSATGEAGSSSGCAFVRPSLPRPA
ncbi:MAG: Ig-like domain-containing protein [Chloroflexaceae bacterium]